MIDPCFFGALEDPTLNDTKKNNPGVSISRVAGRGGRRVSRRCRGSGRPW